MLTDMICAEPVALFVFAHQDDESFVYARLLIEKRLGRRAFCVFMTDGALLVKTPEIRNRESIKVLKRLGVLESDIIFAGEAMAIADGNLPYRLHDAGQWIRDWLSAFSCIKGIYVTAWEGGHHDHDALHAVMVHIAQQKNIIDIVHQFPLYNGYKCPGLFFRVMLPLRDNGSISCTRFPFRNRLLFLKCCLGYPSQINAWIWLFPFFLFHYMFCGVQALQGVCVERTLQRPHSGSLYYEKRRLFSWDEMLKLISAWHNSYSINGSK